MHIQTYRMAGGAPAGIIRPPGDEGCRTISTIIRIITMHGNKSTAPRGTEIFELPLSRMRRLKKDNRGVNLSFSSLRSWREGREGAEGIRFIKFLTSPIAATGPWRRKPELSMKTRMTNAQLN